MPLVDGPNLDLLEHGAKFAFLVDVAIPVVNEDARVWIHVHNFIQSLKYNFIILWVLHLTDAEDPTRLGV